MENYEESANNALDSILKNIDILNVANGNTIQSIIYDTEEISGIIPLDTIVTADDGTIGEFILDQNVQITALFSEFNLTKEDQEYLSSKEFREFVVKSSKSTITQPEMFLMEKLQTLFSFLLAYVRLNKQKMETIATFRGFAEDLKK